jgi:sporulation protein YlmC with PRC-barrel domain
MKLRPAHVAFSVMLALPGVALAQSTTGTHNAAPPQSTATPPETMAPTMATPVTPGTPSNSAMHGTTTGMADTTTGTTTGTTTYTTADNLTRASKVIGATVYNDQNESVGSVNELLINSRNDVSDAVLSVGGFLGMGSKLVKVPFQDIHVSGDKLMISGASKDQLKQMPDYKMASAS